MDENDAAVSCIAQAIVQAFGTLFSSDQSLFSVGVVKEPPALDGGPYTIVVQGSEYTAAPVNDDTYNGGERVLILSLRGSYTKKYIIGKA